MKRLRAEIEVPDCLALIFMIPTLVKNGDEASGLAEVVALTINRFANEYDAAALYFAHNFLQEMFNRDELSQLLYRAFDDAVEHGIALPIEP